MLKPIQLSEQARAELEETFRTTEDSFLRERCQAVLMTSRGRPRAEVAEDLGIQPRTLREWLALYRQGGLPALRITWPPGRTPHLTPEHVPLLVQWVKDGPTACGVKRANWTFADLAAHFTAQTHIPVSETTMRDFCHKHGIRPYRPTYRFLRSNPAEQAQKQAELADLKKRPSGANASC